MPNRYNNSLDTDASAVRAPRSQPAAPSGYSSYSAPLRISLSYDLHTLIWHPSHPGRDCLSMHHPYRSSLLSQAALLTSLSLSLCCHFSFSITSASPSLSFCCHSSPAITSASLSHQLR